MGGGVLFEESNFEARSSWSPTSSKASPAYLLFWNVSVKMWGTPLVAVAGTIIRLTRLGSFSSGRTHLFERILNIVSRIP
jgi:hypothetical protein